ncbi:MAG: hypothetical protein AAGA90_00795 [Actinomycetota bacterium]
MAHLSLKTVRCTLRYWRLRMHVALEARHRRIGDQLIARSWDDYNHAALARAATTGLLDRLEEASDLSVRESIKVFAVRSSLDRRPPHEKFPQFDEYLPGSTTT